MSSPSEHTFPVCPGCGPAQRCSRCGQMFPHSRDECDRAIEVRVERRIVKYLRSSVFTNAGFLADRIEAGAHHEH